MRGYRENYLELAVGYMNDGLYSEASDILNRYTGKDPMISYYLGYIKDMAGNKSEAAKLFKEASAMPVDYVFPFRLEDAEVLKSAIKYAPSDSRPYYYLGNALYDKQPGKAIESWEAAVKHDPSMVGAWRNLGWGYYSIHRILQKL